MEYCVEVISLREGFSSHRGRRQKLQHQMTRACGLRAPLSGIGRGWYDSADAFAARTAGKVSSVASLHKMSEELKTDNEV